jgi:hypothetical protein
MGVLAGPAGRATVIWWDSSRVLVSRRTAGAWSAPVVIATTDLVVPRYTRINDARGVVHYTNGGSGRFIEVGADGYVGPETPSSEFSGATYGTEFAAGGSNAAAIKTEPAADGGVLVKAAQCR